MQMEIFTYHGHPVRVGSHDGIAWFVGQDIAEILGIEDPRNVIAEAVGPDERVPMMMHCDEHDHDYRIDLITCGGAVDLLFEADDADLEGVKHFKSWLADVEEVVSYDGIWCEED